MSTGIVYLARWCCVMGRCTRTIWLLLDCGCSSVHGTGPAHMCSGSRLKGLLGGWNDVIHLSIYLALEYEEEAPKTRFHILF
jgi:hypothetical protein